MQKEKSWLSADDPPELSANESCVMKHAIRLIYGWTNSIEEVQEMMEMARFATKVIEEGL
jgi:uncharacterized protein involved in tolerance to divalent cations